MSGQWARPSPDARKIGSGCTPTATGGRLSPARAAELARSLRSLARARAAAAASLRGEA